MKQSRTTSLRTKRDHRQRIHLPVLKVREHEPDASDHYEFTPRVFLAREREVTCTIGEEGKDRVHICVVEGDWEHTNIFLGINSDGARGEFHGEVTPVQLDRLITALMSAREKARELGLLTVRPVPPRLRWVEERRSYEVDGAAGTRE